MAPVPHVLKKSKYIVLLCSMHRDINIDENYDQDETK